MRRSVSLLLAGAAMSLAFAPAPPPASLAFFEPADPDKDCKFRQTRHKLTIEVPGKYHGLDPVSKRMNAPRLLREVEGDFRMEVRVSGDWPLSATSSAPSKEVAVVGALLVMADEKEGRHASLEFGASRTEKGSSPCCRFHTWGIQLSGGPTWEDWPLAVGAKQAYLRMERQGNEFRCFMSADGKKWVSVFVGFRISMPFPAKVKVGLAALSTSELPSKVHFDEFKLGPLPPEARRPAMPEKR